MKWSRSLYVCSVLLAAAVSAPALGQPAYPNKPIRLIVPVAAGSLTDVVLRAAVQEIGPRLGQQLFVDNKPGASGVIGAEACVNASPDGYTVCAVYHSIMSFNPYTFDKLPYDPKKDFAPIVRLFFVTEGLVVPSSLGVSSVAELRAYATRNPNSVNFGTLGEGSLQELMVAWLNREWKTSIAAIPYKGGGPIATGVAANEIQIAQMGVGNFVGLIQGGQVKPLAISSAKRSRLLPQVETVEEAGMGGFASRPWWGLAAPAATPQAVITRLNAEFTRQFRDPKFLEFLESRYVESATGTPQEFAAFLNVDRENAAALVRLSRQNKR